MRWRSGRSHPLGPLKPSDRIEMYWARAWHSRVYHLFIGPEICNFVIGRSMCRQRVYLGIVHKAHLHAEGDRYVKNCCAACSETWQIIGEPLLVRTLPILLRRSR